MRSERTEKAIRARRGSGRASDQQKNQEKEGSSLVNDTVAPALTWRNNRSTRIDPDTLWVQWTVVGLVGVLGIASFIISFRALYDVAAWAGLGSSIQWAVPVFIDGAILTYALAVLVHRSRGEPVWPSWLSLAVFTALSIAANAAHALSIPQASQTEAVVGAAIAAMAPLGVFAATEELARLVVLRPKDRDAAAATVSASREAAAAPLPATAEEAPATEVAGSSAPDSEARDDAAAAVPGVVAAPEAAVLKNPILPPSRQPIPTPLPQDGAEVEATAGPVAGQWHHDAAASQDDERPHQEPAVVEEPAVPEVEAEAANEPNDGPEDEFSDGAFAEWVREQRRHNHPITGRSAGDFLEVSERTGRNRIKELRAARPELFEGEVAA